MNPKYPSYRIAHASLFGFVVLFCFLLLRTSGVHSDENNYLFFAKNNLLGTVHLDGKPPFFYVFNYWIYHTLGSLMGSYEAFSLHFFYLCFSAFSLAFLSAAIFAKCFQRWTFLFCLLFHPFSLLNFTQVMMETPLLAVSNFLIGCLFLEFKSKKLGKSRIILPASVFSLSALVIMLKITAFPAFVLVAIIFIGKKFKSTAIPALAGAGAGYLLTLLARNILRAPDMQYGGLAGILNINHFIGATGYWGSFFSLWIFFLTPGLLVGALITWRLNRNKTPGDTFEFLPKPDNMIAAALLSLTGSLLMVCMSNYQIGLMECRWHFPLYWFAIILLSIVFMRANRWFLFGAFLLSTSFSSALVSTADQRFALWPDPAVLQFQNYNYHTFIGFPVWRWYLFHERRMDGICVYMPEKKQKDAHTWAKQFLTLTNQKNTFFNESSVKEFGECLLPKAVYSSEYENFKPECSRTCGGGNFSWKSCTRQEVLINEWQWITMNYQVAVCFP